MCCARRILLYSLLGVLVNIAIAWCVTAVTTWPGGFASLEWDEQEIEWPGAVPERWPGPDDLIRYRSFGWNLDRCVAIVAAEDEGEQRGVPLQYMIESVRVGWPLRSLCWERWVDGVPTQAASGGAVAVQQNGQATPGAWRSGIPLVFDVLGFNPDDGKRLPFCPIWGGFIINTILYAIILWLVVWIPRVVRNAGGIAHQTAG